MIEYESAGNLKTKQISGLIGELCTTPEIQEQILNIQHLLEMDLYVDLQDQHFLYSNQNPKTPVNIKD